MYHHAAKIAVLAFLAIFSPGCSTMTRSYTSPAMQEEPSQRFKPGDIIETRSGKRISFEELMEDLSLVRVIYAGEVHISVEDHRIQQQIMEALHDRNPSLTLAMEMFPRQVQPVLDQWSTGMLKEEAFLKEVRWKENWGFPFQLYRGLLREAGDRRMKLLALNAPHRVVSRIAQGGLASLSPEERDRIASDFDREDPKHREHIREQYEQHMEGIIKDFESFYEAQLAWEETMAETLAQHLGSTPAGEQVLVVIGNGHILYGRGVPRRALRRLEHAYRTIVPMPVRSLPQTLDPEMADYVWVTEGKDFIHPHRGRLGIAVRPASSGEGVEVIGVMPESPAAKADIRKGDIVYEINEVPIHTVEDMHNAVTSNTSASAHRIRIKRGAENVETHVVLTPPSNGNPE